MRVASIVLPASMVLAFGCSNSGNGTAGSSGGTSGTVATGGTTSSGGTGGSSSGGISGSGGVTATGGVGTGGVPGTGGASPTGGSVATGGTTSGAGGKAMGGVTSSGGATSLGGATASGGSMASGGATGGGGATSLGGASAAGGSKATGGATGAGGTSKTCGTTAASLKEAAACTGRLIGVALSSQHLSENGYSAAAREFNYVTCENEMKWEQIEPQKGQFSWSAADQVVSFATSNGMKVKGHTLVWYNQLPQWVQSLGSAADVRSAMLSHIKGVMQHYKGKVSTWDVVNEAVSIEGTSYRDCPFYKYLGEGYIDEAFKAARDVDPDVKLYYNDYDDEGLNAKSDFVYKLVKGLVDRGVPIDGVGFQMHYGKPNDAFTLADLKTNLQRYIDLGLDVLYSEMDVHRCSGMTEADQVALYHDLIATCVAEQHCIAATFWGITDKYSWLNSYSPLGCSGSTKPLGDLWDDNFKKKPAYTGVLNALLGL
jgi:endo-1,4-beta-xylanase